MSLFQERAGTGMEQSHKSLRNRTILSPLFKEQYCLEPVPQKEKYSSVFLAKEECGTGGMRGQIFQSVPIYYPFNKGG